MLEPEWTHNTVPHEQRKVTQFELHCHSIRAQGSGTRSFAPLGRTASKLPLIISQLKWFQLSRSVVEARAGSCQLLFRFLTRKLLLSSVSATLLTKLGRCNYLLAVWEFVQHCLSDPRDNADTTKYDGNAPPASESLGPRPCHLSRANTVLSAPIGNIRWYY
jgi:hypothetical protein